MAERCVVAAETLDRYRQAVPDIGRVAHRQSGGLQNRVREGSIPSSPAKPWIVSPMAPIGITLPNWLRGLLKILFGEFAKLVGDGKGES
jgi:hypothetical protein